MQAPGPGVTANLAEDDLSGMIQPQIPSPGPTTRSFDKVRAVTRGGFVESPLLLRRISAFLIPFFNFSHGEIIKRCRGAAQLYEDRADRG